MSEQERRTYKMFAEVKETLSPAEEHFERWRTTVGLFLGPLVGLLLYLIPLPSLTDQAHRLSAVIGWVVIWWVTEPIPLPMTALIGALLCIPFGIAPAKTVLATLCLRQNWLKRWGQGSSGLVEQRPYGALPLSPS